MWLICKHWMRQQAQIGQQGAHTPRQKKTEGCVLKLPRRGIALSVLELHCSLQCLPFASEPWNPAPWLWLYRTMRQGSGASVAMLQHDDICTLPSKLPHCLFFIEKCITSLRSQENQFTSCSLWVWYVMTQLLSSRKMYIFAEGSNWWLFSSPVAAPVSHLNSCEVASFSFFTATLMLLALFIPFSSIWTIKMPQPACGTNKSTPAKESDF